MVHRIGRKKYQIYGFDLESHNDDESIAKQETSMWLGCLLDENSRMEDESCYFYDMDSFLNRLDLLSLGKRHNKSDSKPIKNICLYIYNLSFEWSFILPYLLKRGFTYKNNIEKNDEYCYSSVSTHSASSIWHAEFKFAKRNGKIILRDLAKMFGGGLRKVAESFNLETQKGDLDYRLNRLHGHIITQEEKEYCFKDVRILVEILLELIKRNDKEFFNCMSMASYSMKKLLKYSFNKSFRPYREFRKVYPELEQKETDFLRHAVAGGITYAPRKWQFKDIEKEVAHIDAHQMYPSMMASKEFPVGFGEYFVGKPTKLFKHLNCLHVRISYFNAKLHSVISLIGIDMIEDRELWLWDFELITMKKVYEGLEVEYIDGYCYKTKFLPCSYYLEDNYRHRLECKNNNDKFGSLYYKLLNNSCYGKFVEHPHNEDVKNIINENGIITSEIIEKPIEEQRINAKYTYLPVGSCIPAYARCCLIENALKVGWENVCYFDTDSIFFIWNDKTKKIWEEQFNHEDWLSGWNMEEICTRAQFTAPKRYKTESEGKATIKAGGINFKEYISQRIDPMNNMSFNERNEAISKYDISYDEINITSSTWKVQRAYRVRGGTLIEFQFKKMDIQKKYIDIYNENAKI